MSNKLIEEIKRSRDTLVFLQQMGIDHLPLTSQIESFLNVNEPSPAGLRKPQSEPADKTSSPGSFHGFPKMMTDDSNPVLEEISSDILKCTSCDLHKHRSTILTGEGLKEARLFIIEEKPAEAEEKAGTCIAGEAGALFDKMIQAIGLERADVYITSVVKCRPENDRPPTDIEINTCLPFLARQISAVKPAMIYTLGPLAAKVMTGSNLPLFRVRGKFHDFHGTPLMASFHPTFLLKNEEMKKASWIDLQMIQKKLTEKN